MLTSAKYAEKQIAKMSGQELSAELYKCRKWPFYFIWNYVMIPEIGGVLKYEENVMHLRMKQVVKGIMKFHKVLLMASRQLGKALSISTPIPTPQGLTSMEAIHPGDYVLDDNFLPTQVLAVTDIMYNRPCYLLEFDVDDEIIADAEHLWKVYDIRQKREVLYTSQELFLEYQKGLTFDILLTHNETGPNKVIHINDIYMVSSTPVKCIQVSNPNGMFLCGEKYIPTHNSTISAALLEWACNFYPRTPATIINANKTFALENLEKVKFIHNNLPNFLRNPLKGRGEFKTKMEYDNGSLLRIFYPSSSNSPSMLARSLTSPILYIDESAHIPNMRLAFGSAQPTLSSAREQAIKNGYPYFILTTTTPNGTIGVGEWFYSMWQNAVDSDALFDDDNNFVSDAQTLVDDPVRNGFVKIRFHWSEDPRKDDEWYQQQKRDLNFDTRMINQELDLGFVGSTTCLFSDDFLSQLKPRKIVDKIKLPHGVTLNLYTHRQELDKTDYYILGVDNAKSFVGDFNGLEIFSYANFIQIGEYYGKLGSLTKYSECLKELFKILYPIVDGRLLLAIESNNMGNTILENLENDPDFNYIPFIYSPNPDKLGIWTSAQNKGIMISCLYDYIANDPQNLKSVDLINQLHIIERKGNGSISAQRGYHDDLFMASALAAYVKKLSAIEYEPLLGVSTLLQQQQSMKQTRNAFRTVVTSPTPMTQGIGVKFNTDEGGIEYIIDDNLEAETSSGEPLFSFV